MKDLEVLYKEWREVCYDLGQDTDCVDVNNRRDFSAYAELDEEISFEVMLELERAYN
jgi:hypothetical protein